jgi:acetolactate synthase I/II/III large subunit
MAARVKLAVPRRVQIYINDQPGETLSMSNSFRGAQAVAETLKQAGIKKIFTLSGNHIMPVFDALLDSGIELYHVRHEGAAVHMADAYARITEKIGVALVTGGPGHANAVGALYTAQQGETPILLLSGHAPLKELGKGAFQEMKQAEIASPLTKASWNIASAADLAGDLAKAIQMARAGRPGPVHVSLPSDILEDSAPQMGTLDFNPKVTALSGNAMTALVGHLQAAKRPLLVLPPALCTEQGVALYSHLAALGLPAIPMESPRGINDPSLGDFGALLRKSDLIVLLGKAVDFTLKFGNVGSSSAWIVIDPDESILQRAKTLLGPKLTFTAIADSTAVIQQLVSSKAWPVPDEDTWPAEIIAALAKRPEQITPASGTLNSYVMNSALGAYMKHLNNAIFICDGGEIGQWAQAFIQTPCRIINGVAGAIGSAIPFALGAKAAAPDRPVLAVMGDGTFGFHMAEFETAIRHNLPFVAVIGNDGRWNAEYQIQKRDYGSARTFGCELLPGTRYDAAISALGGHGELVTTEAEIIPALDRAFASGKPACVNILIEGLPAPKF